ncbi:MAG: hypothetical protein Q7S81_02415 [bacterium]|nr:hypothetical protein [bacterium]
MKKININKSDEAALIVEKIIETDSDEVILIIPRFSQLGESLSNFHLLKREADAISKKILIESVDNRVIELAELAGIEAINPFFVKNKRQFSDIIPKKEKSGSGKKDKPSVSTRETSRGEEDWKKEEEFIKKISSNLSLEEFENKQSRFHKKEKEERVEEESSEEVDGSEEKESFIKKIPIKMVVGAVVLGLVVFGAVTILPKVDIKLVSKKIDWSYNDSVITQVNAKADYKTVTIPNQKSTSSKSSSLPFPATGKKQVSDKASGKMTIYNSYSSDAQTLVKDTRFLSPDGKIFKLAKQIIVPGAKISEGKILPSSIDADVVAEKAGEEYNVGPVKLFQIPGFKGTPKYAAFYGESKGSMAGGFVGEISYPTTSDIAAAKKKMKETLESSLKTELYSKISSDFKIVEGSSVFSTTKEEINETVDKDGNFSISSEAQMTVISFKESDLIDVLSQKAKAEKGENYAVKSHSLEYGIARMDVASGRLSFPMTFKAVLSYKTDIEKLKSDIADMSDIKLRETIFSLPSIDMESQNVVSFWPFWVKTVPNNLNKINITVD